MSLLFSLSESTTSRDAAVLLFIPEGSPTLVVPPPTSTTALCPVFCSSRKIIICTSEPTCSEDAVAYTDRNIKERAAVAKGHTFRFLSLLRER